MKQNRCLSLLMIIAATAILSGCSKSITQPLTLKGPAQPDERELNPDNPGDRVDIADSTVRGKYTIVEFYSPYCPPCMAIKPHVLELANARRDIAVRAVNINRPGVEGIDWHSPVAQQYGLEYVPNFKIYGPDKRLINEGKEATADVVACINASLGGGN